MACVSLIDAVKLAGQCVQSHEPLCCFDAEVAAKVTVEIAVAVRMVFVWSNVPLKRAL